MWDNTHIGDIGAKHIACALETSTMITHINLSSQQTSVGSGMRACDGTGNNIGDAAAEHIARALEKNTTLTEIDLSSAALHAEHDISRTTRADCTKNNIGAAGAEHIARILEKNTTIIRIDLGD